MMKDDVRELIAKMTPEEKVLFLSGADFWNTASLPRLGIPSIMMTDGPHGLRKHAGSAKEGGIRESVPATCFPTASATASSWNRGLLREMGRAIGEEALQEGVSVVLGPGANMKRSPLCGRNFEYFSEDPFLAGEMAAAWIEGLQSMGVGASLKHFAVNNQETRRMTVNALVDERTLREYYLPAFEAAVRKARPWTVMCAYNLLNGNYCSENEWLLTEVLREDWEFEGVLLTDWGACNNRVFGLACGQDLEMPHSGGETNRDCLYDILRSPARTSFVDRSLERVLGLIRKGEEAKRPGFRYDAAEHHAVARKLATESMVLLRNDGILPLREGVRLALIGDMAERPRYQGAGSSLINPTRLDTTRGEIGAYAGQVAFARGYDQSTEVPDEALIAEAVEAAREAEVALVYVGLTAAFEVEGADRSHLRLPASHDRLVEAVAAANPNTVVVLQNGSAVALPWLGKVRAVLEGFIAGQAAAGAALDLLFGRACPSGKLAESYPAALEDLASTKWFPGGPETVEYREGPYVGYRWFDASGVKPLFPFGFGLSYTSFEYEGLELSSPSFTPGGRLRARFTVRNSGKVAGAEVVQLYVRDVAATVHRPVKELKGFDKVHLAPGASAVVELELDDRAFAFWEPGLQAWYVEGGDFEILVGASAADIRLRATVRASSSVPDLEVEGSHLPRTRRAELPNYYDVAPGFSPDGAEWARLYARRLPAQSRFPGARFTMNSTIDDLSERALGRFLRNMALADSRKSLADEGTRKMMESSVGFMPLRNLAALSGGRVSRSLARFLLALMNVGRRRKPPRKDRA